MELLIFDLGLIYIVLMTSIHSSLTVHVNILAQFNQLHLSWHVAHCSHQVPQVFAGDKTILIFIKFYKGFT